LDDMTDKAIRLQNIHLSLGRGAARVHILQGISLDVARGEAVGLVGPSGSGKSTLLMTMAGLERPDSGRVEVDGIDLSRLDEDALARFRGRRIGIVFQSYNLFPTLTAEENVRVALDVRGEWRWRARKQARAALVEVGLKQRVGSYPRQLSGGEQQRVAVARALASAPSVILADEPTAALDAENGQAVMALIAKIAMSERRAVLAVTHDPRTLPFADRIIHIEDGRLVGEERPSARARAAGITELRKKVAHA
jgi:putative ABC transport system ATP-binding protein